MLVSIPSQPEGRELLNPYLHYGVTYGFQSPPSPKAGSYGIVIMAITVCMGFNPLPARRPGATRPSQTAPTPYPFQSPPSPKAGSYPVSVSWRISSAGFNPLPARRPGATYSQGRRRGLTDVSIPSQPEGRELPVPVGLCVRGSGFQSPPSPKAGSYLRWLKSLETDPCFNPLPARRPGATSPADVILDVFGFNPLPARRPGATCQEQAATTSLLLFQSPPSPKAGSYVMPYQS